MALTNSRYLGYKKWRKILGGYVSQRLEKLKEELKDFSPKQMRTLRNNLNNRIQSYTNSFKEAKELPESHKLYALEEGECRELLGIVKKILVQAKFKQD